MSVLRINKKQQNFVILDKTCLNDTSISWSARGLHAFLMSKPDNWKVRVSALIECAPSGRDVVRGLLNELEDAGYISKSVCRDETNGRFKGIEYVVYEVPQLNNKSKTPLSITTSLIELSPEKPASGSPSSVNPTLISNKNNNKLLTKKAAASCIPKKGLGVNSTKAAAAFVDKNNTRKAQANNFKAHQNISLLTAEDAVIGETFTSNQLNRVETMIHKFNVSNSQALTDEVKFCLLSPKHFTACGQDFGRKLNAIRTVILRGEWQTPAEMVLKRREKETTSLQKLEKELQEVKAEAIHFKRLLTDVKPHSSTHEHFETILLKANLKIKRLQEEIALSIDSNAIAS